MIVTGCIVFSTLDLQTSIFELGLELIVCRLQSLWGSAWRPHGGPCCSSFCVLYQRASWRSTKSTQCTPDVHAMLWFQVSRCLPGKDPQADRLIHLDEESSPDVWCLRMTKKIQKGLVSWADLFQQTIGRAPFLARIWLFLFPTSICIRIYIWYMETYGNFFVHWVLCLLQEHPTSLLRWYPGLRRVLPSGWRKNRGERLHARLGSRDAVIFVAGSRLSIFGIFEYLIFEFDPYVQLRVQYGETYSSK